MTDPGIKYEFGKQMQSASWVQNASFSQKVEDNIQFSSARREGSTCFDLPPTHSPNRAEHANDLSSETDSDVRFSSARREGSTCFDFQSPEKEKKYIDPAELKSFKNDDSNPLNDEDAGINSNFQMPPFVSKASKVLKFILLLLAAAATVFIVTETASFLASVRKLSLLEQIFLSIPMAIFAGIILYLIINLFFLLRKFHVSPQISIKALEQLEERRSLRKLSLMCNRDAVKKLSRFLESYPSDGVELKKLGISSDVISRLEKNRRKLIESANNLPGTTQDWIVDFRINFQNKLDEIAKKRIQYYSWNVAVMTGISPFSLIDRLIVLSGCLSMLKEFMQIFALKPSWDKNLVLMGKVIIQTYLAGIIYDVADTGIDAINSKLLEGVGEGIPDFACKVASGFSKKVTEGAIQGFMIFRLGKSALKILHPVCASKKEENLLQSIIRNNAKG